MSIRETPAQSFTRIADVADLPGAGSAFEVEVVEAFPVDTDSVAVDLEQIAAASEAAISGITVPEGKEWYELYQAIALALEPALGERPVVRGRQGGGPDESGAWLVAEFDGFRVVIAAPIDGPRITWEAAVRREREAHARVLAKEAEEAALDAADTSTAEVREALRARIVGLRTDADVLAWRLDAEDAGVQLVDLETVEDWDGPGLHRRVIAGLGAVHRRPFDGGYDVDLNWRGEDVDSPNRGYRDYDVPLTLVRQSLNHDTGRPVTVAARTALHVTNTERVVGGGRTGGGEYTTEWVVAAVGRMVEEGADVVTFGIAFLPAWRNRPADYSTSQYPPEGLIGELRGLRSETLGKLAVWSTRETSTEEMRAYPAMG